MEEKKLILIVEDNERFNNFMAAQLSKNGYETRQAYNGQQAYDQLKRCTFDLIILDLNLGDITGLSILRTIRLQDKLLPVMIISSLSDDETKLEGFRIGCDDYLSKPFYVTELLMRIGRMLERRELTDCVASQPIRDVILCGPFELDASTLTVRKNGVPLTFTKKQFDILFYLAQNRDKIISYKELYEHVWEKSESDEKVAESNLYVHINNLRKLIEDNPAKPVYIRSIRELGYLFAAS